MCSAGIRLGYAGFKQTAFELLSLFRSAEGEISGYGQCLGFNSRKVGCCTETKHCVHAPALRLVPRLLWARCKVLPLELQEFSVDAESCRLMT